MQLGPSGRLWHGRYPLAPTLPSLLRDLPAVLEPERVTGLADQARVRFHAAA